MRVPSCSSISSALGEPLAGTASQVRRWLLIEDPGPWGYDALAHNRVPQPLMDALRSWARSVSARVVLIRRGPQRLPGARKIFVVSSVPGNQWISALTSDDLDALVAVDNEGMATGDGVPGERQSDLYLVCTHGRHDRCCSVRGNPVSRLMCSEFGEESWECSHIGGDRFAANVVFLPRGGYFGRLSKDSALQATQDYQRGVLDIDHFRGWSPWPFAVQAAELAVRKEFDLVGIDDVVPESWNKLGASELAVQLSTTKFDVVDVRLRLRKSDDEFFLTCRTEQKSRPTLFEIVSIDT